MKLFSVFPGCFRLFSVVLLLSVVFGIHKDPKIASKSVENWEIGEKHAIQIRRRIYNIISDYASYTKYDYVPGV